MFLALLARFLAALGLLFMRRKANGTAFVFVMLPYAFPFLMSDT